MGVNPNWSLKLGPTDMPFAQNLEMCTPYLEKFCLFTTFKMFLHLLCDFMGRLCALSCAKF